MTAGAYHIAQQPRASQIRSIGGVRKCGGVGL